MYKMMTPGPTMVPETVMEARKQSFWQSGCGHGFCGAVCQRMRSYFRTFKY